MDRVSTGCPWPLGATIAGDGVNFTLFSAHATCVELDLIDAAGTRTVPLTAHTDGVWHAHVAGVGAGQRYLYRVDGPSGPQHRFDPTRLLLDPAARMLAPASDARAASDFVSVVAAPSDFAWGADAPPATAWADTLLYEVQVRGATMRHPDVPAPLRGTYAGLASDPMLAHYRRLGVTALCLLPVQLHLDESRLVARGLRNYWGYNPLNFFAPEPRYAVHPQPDAVAGEFRGMVRTLHAAGIEVILDVVFNHTAESDDTGPTVSWRGIDHASYYRLDAIGAPVNHTGCGNTVNLAHPRVLQQVLDALRHWVLEFHVDGFRFDLAATLSRDSAFLAALDQDPVLGRVKRIAEPWDLGPDGYHLGRFPAGWREWNDRFRDDVRAFWLTHGVGIDRLAQRLAGSSEVLRQPGRTPQAGIHYLAAHDGFTLRDLVSYRHKRNLANGEDNRDGPAEGSDNCGAEGDSADPAVLACRARRVRALLATLFVAQGVPMLQAGDELGRTQCGNNNAYCQDNALTWIDWAAADARLIDTVTALAALRRRFPALRRQRWLTGEPQGPDGAPDCRWAHPDGRDLTAADWQNPALSALALTVRDDAGGAPLLLLFNRGTPTPAVLPDGDWRRVFDSAALDPDAIETTRGRIRLGAETVQVWERVGTPG